jgi:hypothetical protein
MLMLQIGQSDLGLEHRNYYIGESKVTKAYQQYMRNVALEMTNMTSMIDSDVTGIFEFEKKIAKVSFCLLLDTLHLNSLKQYHWPADKQRARIFENVRTTIGDLSRIVNTSVSVSVSFTVNFFI